MVTPDIASLSISSLKSGYNNLKFIGKETQYEAVLDLLDKYGLIPENLIESETNWFYNSLGIDDIFFGRQSVEDIVSHIHALYSAKIDAFASKSENEKFNTFIHHKRESSDHAVYFDTSKPGSVESKLTNYEERIDSKYLDQLEKSYRVESFSAPLILNDSIKSSSIENTVIRAHFVYENKFNSDSIYDETFSKIVSTHTKNLYNEVSNNVLNSTGPIIKHFQIENSDEHRVIIGYKSNSTKKYFSALSSLINYYKLDETRKYVENFSNDVTIISIYLKPNAETNPLSIYQLIREVSLLYTIPKSFFQDSFASSTLSLQESIYSHIGVIFVTHFLNRLGPEYQQLLKILGSNDNSLELLSSLKKRLRSETFTQQYIIEVFQTYQPILQQLFRSFADTHYIQSNLEKTLSYQRLSKIEQIKSDKDFNDLLQSHVFNENHALVLKALFNFNKSILKTNFFVSNKTAISFRLNPDLFLSNVEYPEIPYGLFFIVGAEFRGFHIRFRDIARGGIRIVKSRSQDAYDINVRNLFDENYNLASTQQRKNKDIPEGGSKGVILLDLDAQDYPKTGFEKYVDSVIDLLLPNSKNEKIVDLYGKEEILFLGPDEGTATYTDWATLHAKSRGAKWWKSFLTGKSANLGGIPHDEYGMTSLSVRSYVEKIYETHDLVNKPIRKFQTGGPDGDLGSNEILLSTDNEVYVGLVDGSGVIVDTNGLDKDELKRLAHSRQMINHFDKSKLSSKGFVILVDDVNFKIPETDEIIPNGVFFRNHFHLEIEKYLGSIDLFVPCGGRPAAIDIDTVSHLLPNGQPIVKYIVEGANLFITQQAKLKLEHAGVIIFKDASANKGGVTSSSLEVLASLVLNDDEFKSQFYKGSKFYDEYVKEVQAKIISNAHKEADALLRLQKKTGLTLSESSDLLSIEINKLSDLIANSDELWNDINLRLKILSKSVPSLLIKQTGSIELFLERVPENYAKSLFATSLSTDFIYHSSLDFGNVIELLHYLKQ